MAPLIRDLVPRRRGVVQIQTRTELLPVKGAPVNAMGRTTGWHHSRSGLAIVVGNPTKQSLR